jgi:exodeoxyribonuclease VII small subunit
VNESESWDYEMTADRIESAIAAIESGRLSLAEVFEQFASATEDLKRCEAFLNRGQHLRTLWVESLEEDEPEF